MTLQKNATPSGRRTTKFTPENIQKIKDWVAEGISREEIAKLIDVTVGSLQVTCSRLGISLRRPHMRYPSYDRLKTQLQLRMVEKGSRPQGKFAITTHRKDNVRAVDVPLSVEAIGQLGLYASLRDMGLVELIAREAVDGGLEVDDGAEDAAFQAAPGQPGEEALDRIEPGA